MKIAINKCYGGFGLSPKAVARLAELNGQKAYFFVGGIGDKPLKQVAIEKINSMFWSAYNTPNPTLSCDGAEWAAMSSEEKNDQNAKDEAQSLDSRPDNRTDPLLIQVIEELGEDASGSCAELEVIEIPDGVQYEIEEYDGMESIHETHRSWS